VATTSCCARSPPIKGCRHERATAEGTEFSCDSAAARDRALAQARRLARTQVHAGEAEAFKRWLYSIAQRVADASGEGGLLGIGSEKVSEAERAALVQIAQALRLDV